MVIDLDSGRGVKDIRRFVARNYSVLLNSLLISKEDPVTTKLAIQVLALIMKQHKEARIIFCLGNTIKEWREDPDNFLYREQSVEGILLVSTDDFTDDILATEVQQFIYYTGEKYWPLKDVNTRIEERFKRVWNVKSEELPSLPFPDR